MWHKISQTVGLVLLVCSARSQDAKPNLDPNLNWINELYYGEQIGSRFDLTPTAPQSKTCTTDTKEAGVCTKTSKCAKDAPPIDTSNDFILREKGQCHLLEICCPKDKVLEKSKKPKPPSNVGCGYSNPGASVFREKTGSSRSGYADYGEFPWMVALLKSGGAEWKSENYIGGGTLIHPSVVMTVAHKVVDSEPSELKCRAGEWETQSDTEAFSHQEQNVVRIIVHEEYYALSAHNDIALLFVKDPFTVEPHINVACLSLTLPPPGTVCYSMGWGEDFTKSNKYANLLKKLTLPMVSADVCQSRYRNTRLGSRYSLHRSLTCAGGEAMVDTCLGDGGSSLVCPIGNPNDIRYAVVGIVAYGLECGTENLPGVYVKVPEFYDWVGKQMVLNGYTANSYMY